jgi:hypothetical protein
LRFEDLIVSRLGGRLIAAVAVWLGLAMLGYGPRAAASFVVSATTLPQIEATGGAGPAEMLPAEDSQLPSALVEKLQACQCETPQQTGGGAGSTTSNAPTGPAGAAIMPTTIGEQIGPTAATRLRQRDALAILDPVLASIFEPPRAK